MDFKKIKVSEKKLNEVLDFEYNFGWREDKYERKILYLSRDFDRQYSIKLNKIEAEITKAKKAFPIASILYLILAVAFMIFSFVLMPKIDFSFLDELGETKETVLKIVNYISLGFGALFGFVAVVLIIAFIVAKARKKKIEIRMINLAKEFTGENCKVPLKTCIKEPGTNSNILSKMNF